MSPPEGRTPRICFVGLDNLPALAPEYQNRSMGGAQLQQTLLAKGLLRRGFEVSMVVADLGQPEGATWHCIRTHKAYASTAGLPVMRFFHPRLTGVWAAMARANADIYYCSCAGLLPGQLALFAQWRTRPARTVFRMAHDTDAQPDKLLIPNWRGKALYRYGLPRMDLVLAQTAHQQSEMQRNFNRSSVVLSSLVEEPDPAAMVTGRDIDALWISNLRPFKRPELVMELAALCPENSVHMAGGTQPGHEEYFDQLKQRAQQIPALTFHGAVSYDHTNALMCRTRIFVNTSESEGFPNTYMQAWVRGVPVIGFFDPDGVIAREGLGITVRSITEMRAAMQALLANTGEWKTISDRCRAYVRRTHGSGALDKYAQALLELHRLKP